MMPSKKSPLFLVITLLFISAFLGVAGGGGNPAIAAGSPSTPSSFTATKLSACTVKLDWQQVGTVDSFELWRSTTNTLTPHTTQTLTPGTLVTYDDQNLDPAITYYYQMRSWSGTNNSAFTSAQSVTTNALTAPQAPTFSRVTRSDSGGKQALLVWTSPVISQYGGFEISRAVSANGGKTFGNYTVIESALPNTFTSYTDNDHSAFLDPTKVYEYRIRSFENDLGCGVARNAYSTFSPDPSGSSGIVAPIAPTGMTASYVFSPGNPDKVNISWSYTGEKSIVYYEIYRNTNQNPLFTSVQNPADLSYSDTNVQANLDYSYKVWACTGTTAEGCSDFSNVSTVTIAGGPQNFQAAVTAVTPGTPGTGTVHLSWNNTFPDRDYYIERKVDGGTYSALTTIPAKPPAVTSLTYDDTGSFGHSYTYHVRAAYGTTFTAWSVERTVDLNVAMLRGWAWSGIKDAGGNGPFGAGWIRLSNDSVDPNGTSQAKNADSQPYSVLVDDQGNLSGYAWSGIACKTGETRPATGQGSTCGYGWLSFSGATVDWTTDKVSGWAQFAAADPTNGGWDGKVSLRAHGNELGYGLCIGALKTGDTSGATCAGGVSFADVQSGKVAFNGYAWGGNTIVGWIQFTSSVAGTSNPSTNNAPTLLDVTQGACQDQTCSMNVEWTNPVGYSEVKIYVSPPSNPNAPIGDWSIGKFSTFTSPTPPSGQAFKDSVPGLQAKTLYGFFVRGIINTTSQ